jgi:hypothetical protein
MLSGLAGRLGTCCRSHRTCNTGSILNAEASTTRMYPHTATHLGASLSLLLMLSVQCSTGPATRSLGKLGVIARVLIPHTRICPCVGSAFSCRRTIAVAAAQRYLLSPPHRLMDRDTTHTHIYFNYVSVSEVAPIFY